MADITKHEESGKLLASEDLIKKLSVAVELPDSSIWKKKLNWNVNPGDLMLFRTNLLHEGPGHPLKSKSNRNVLFSYFASVDSELRKDWQFKMWNVLTMTHGYDHDYTQQTVIANRQHKPWDRLSCVAKVYKLWKLLENRTK